MIYQELTVHDTAAQLRDDRHADWTRGGALAMAEYLVQMSEGNGEDMELDIVAIRCEYTEWASLEEYLEAYLLEADTCETWADVAENATVVEFGNGRAIVEDH